MAYRNQSYPHPVEYSTIELLVLSIGGSSFTLPFGIRHSNESLEATVNSTVDVFCSELPLGTINPETDGSSIIELDQEATRAFYDHLLFDRNTCKELVKEIDPNLKFQDFIKAQLYWTTSCTVLLRVAIKTIGCIGRVRFCKSTTTPQTKRQERRRKEKTKLEIRKFQIKVEWFREGHYSI
ncbi:hypothetical protein WN51_12672 [Melipona quadrifasciata]|uniref:Uncharacterized protein n=1 Tax=Melipona quadrifasciata TaxID=166423 RepID=A0A0N0BGL8_9HYME|nr:hypothetical protein WN51_12672 [Melipona quadrifasciata]